MAAIEGKSQEALAAVQLPRITIKFCTQCRWMLRAAYVREIKDVFHKIISFAQKKKLQIVL